MTKLLEFKSKFPCRFVNPPHHNQWRLLRMLIVKKHGYEYYKQVIMNETFNSRNY